MAWIQSAVTKTFSTRGVIVLVAAAGLVLSSCGSCGSSPTSSTSSTSSNSSESHSPTPSPKATLISKADACTLVTVADVLTATGLTVTSLAGAASVPGACFYASADGSTSVLVFAQVYPDTNTAEAVSPDTMAASLNGAVGIANAKVVNGIGDKAVEYTSTSGAGSGAVIFVFKSNVVLFIDITPIKAGDTTGLEKLATIAVGRLS